MEITRLAKFTIAGTSLVAGVVLVQNLAAQAPEVKLQGQRQFMAVGANGTTAWVIDVYAQKMIACGFESGPRNQEVTCKVGLIPR